MHRRTYPLRRAALPLLALVFVLIPRAAWAEARLGLAVLGRDAQATSAMEHRVGRELELRGFRIVPHTVPAEKDPVDASLAHARAHDAVVGVVVTLAPDGGAQIDVVDRVTGKRLQRTLPGGANANRSTIALAAAELVDASLAELHLRPTTAVGEVDPPPDLPVPAIDDRVDGQVEAAVGMLWPVRHRTPVGVVTVALGMRPATRVAVLAEGTVPMHALRREVPLARVRTFPFLVGVRADVDVLPLRSPVRLDLQAAVQALALRVDVDPAPGAHGDPRTIWTTAVQVGPSLHGAVGTHVHLGGAVRVVVPFDDLRIRFDEQTVQRLGPVWVGAAATLAARF